MPDLTYHKYLLKKGLATATITEYQKKLRHFLSWCADRSIEVEFITYDELLNYIRQLRDQHLPAGGRGLTQATIKHHYIAIKHYYDLLIWKKLIDQNPVTAIKLKGKQTKPIQPILTTERLEALYTNLDPKTLYATREKVTLGLMVFQAITSGELAKLTVQSIHLQKGSMTILGSHNRAARSIALQPTQILSLYDYLQRVRPQLITKHGRPKDDQRLLIHTYAKECDAVYNIISKLKATEPHLINANQIRTSVITHWLKTYNLREVQYMAGHHSIKSTETYRHNDTQSLLNEIDKYHPSAYEASAK